MSDFGNLQLSRGFWGLALLLLFLSSVLWDQSLALTLGSPAFADLFWYSREITNIGWAEHWYALAIMVWLLGHFGTRMPWTLLHSKPRQSALKSWALHFALALLCSGLALQIIKHLVGRERPFLTPDHMPYVFVGPTLDSHWHSFPSGHAQVLGCVAVALSVLKPQWKYFCIAVAFAFALTRVFILQHFLSDVTAGFLLGVFVSLWIWKRKLPTRLQKLA